MAGQPSGEDYRSLLSPRLRQAARDLAAKAPPPTPEQITKLRLILADYLPAAG